MENVYDYVKEVDDIWVLIEDKEYLRVSFEKNLTSVNDITIFARSLNNDSARVEVYVLQGDDSGEPKNSYVKIAEFENVGEEGWYKIYLTGLFGSQDSFDLRVIGNVEFDYVVDPTTGGTVSAGLRPQNVTCYADGIEVSCGGTYPGSCPAGGGGDHLSCDDASAESHSTRKNDSARVQAIYYNSSINDCVNVSDSYSFQVTGFASDAGFFPVHEVPAFDWLAILILLDISLSLPASSRHDVTFEFGLALDNHKTTKPRASPIPH